MVSTITITGRLGTVPQCYTTESGNAFTRFRMAHTPRLRRGDEWVDGETVWFTVRTYGQLARNSAILQQGNAVLAVGQWRVETWIDTNGVERVDNVLVADSLGPDFQFCRAQILPRLREERVPDRDQAGSQAAAELAADGTAAGDNATGDNATGDNATGETKPLDQAISGEVSSVGATSSQTKPNQARPTRANKAQQKATA